VCAGFSSLRDAHVRVAAGAASYTYATALGVSVTAGRSIYATIGAGRTRDAELDASTYPLSLELGADISGGPRRVFVCPVAGVAVSLGPYNYLLSQQNYRYVDRFVGLGLAAVAVQTRGLMILLSGQLRAARITATYWYTGDQAATSSGWSASDDYWLASLGVGIVLGGRVTIRPGVTIPFGLVPPGAPTWFAVPFGREKNEVSLGIAVGFSFGGRRASP
jgi:hypothetical protein